MPFTEQRAYARYYTVLRQVGFWCRRSSSLFEYEDVGLSKFDAEDVLQQVLSNLVDVLVVIFPGYGFLSDILLNDDVKQFFFYQMHLAWV